MKQLLLITMAVLLLGVSSAAEPQKQNPQTRDKAGSVEQRDIKLGEEFKIRNISGNEVTVAIVERSGAHYIRSNYHHGWATETRHYAVSNGVMIAFKVDRTINIVFSEKPDQKLVGAIYVINNHGQAVKVDDITSDDLTW